MLTLAAFLVEAVPRGGIVSVAGLVFAGVVGWTAIEYALHRFVLHGLQPFRGWHQAHHRRPSALICAPTLLSASLILMLVFLPAWMLGNLRSACAITLGLLMGYFAYAVTHHAAHHWRADNAWMKHRKRWHAMHHHAQQPGCYGVTSSLWDRVFGTAADSLKH